MSERIVCKPTPWFLLRAAAMLLMFGIFAAMFYVDGTTGYRGKNLAFYVSKVFEQATSEFKAKRDEMTPETWRAFAEKQVVPFPEDTTILPQGTQVPMPWPEVLRDYGKMDASLEQEADKLFNDYRLEADIRHDAPEHDYPARKIQEQWVVFWICLALTAGALVVLLRTLGRSVSIDGEALYPAGGGRVPFGDLVRLDLRKWKKKGLAYVWAKTPAGGERKHRIDGFVYGGFNRQEDDLPEQLLRRLRANFSGELIEYVAVTPEPENSPPPEA